MTIVTGTRLGRYEIRSKIGEGGMGEVYLALDTELDRTVAIKILPPALASNQKRLQRFIQEAKAASALNHPHILTIHEIGTTGASRFIATEFIDGETLRDHIRAGLKLTDSLEILIQAGSALAAAHAAGIIHRDIKPENIMVRRDGFVKVLDFGLAKLTAVDSANVDTEAPTRFKTDPGTVVGTAVYMSPEQARGLNVDARTDIFSLGVLLYEMVAGRLPFDGSTSSEVLASILSEKEPQPLARYSREAPAELERIVSKALRKNRDERYQTIKDMLLDLKSLKQELEFERKLERSLPPKSQSPADTGEQAETETVMQSAARPTVGERGPMSAIKLNQRSVVIAVAALLIIAAGLGLYFYFMRARGAINSVAILPFVNMSKDPNTEYLSDGITDSLINSLSQLPNIRMIPRGSVFRYKGHEVDPQQVGRDLNVQAIVTGRITQLGDNLSISAELVDVRTNSHLWGEQYSARVSDLLSVQHQIASQITSNLRLKLSGAEQARVTKHYTESPEAYQLYLKGRYYWNKRTDEGIKKSIEYFQQAIEKDPGYALAYTGVSDSYTSFGFPLGSLPPKEVMPKAKAAATRALELDNTLAEAHTSLAMINLLYDWNWPAAEREFQLALGLNPNYAHAHHWYSHYLLSMGRTDESLAESRRALELAPLDLIINVHLGWHYLYAAQYDLAAEQFKKTLEMDQNYVQTHLYLGLTYEEKGMHGEAVAELQKALALAKESTEIQAELGHAYAVAGKRVEAMHALDELRGFSERRFVSAYNIATIYAGLEQKDQAFDWLEKAYEERSDRLVYIKVDAKLDGLRSDPRFQDLLRRVGFPQ